MPGVYVRAISMPKNLGVNGRNGIVSGKPITLIFLKLTALTNNKGK